MAKRNDIMGVGLAGGNSSRMGQNKALLRVGEETFIGRAANVLQQVFENVIISANNRAAYEAVGFPVVEDVHKGCGPLAGIHAAMASAGKADIFVLSCDLPFVDVSVIERILENASGAEAIIAGDGTGPQPLCGLYRQTCMKVIQGQLEVKEYSVLKLVQHMKGRVVVFEGEESSPFLNVNTPSQYNEALRLLTPP